MNKTAIVLFVLLVSVFLVGCSKDYTTGYAAYNQPQGQQQQPYVGGGCGVAPSADYGGTPIEALDSSNSAL